MLSEDDDVVNLDMEGGELDEEFKDEENSQSKL